MSVLDRKSSNSNYASDGTIGVPHSFMIGPEHINYAHDNFSGRLDKNTLKKVPCCWENCSLEYEEHLTALAIKCFKNPNSSNELQSELTIFLKGITSEVEGDPACKIEAFTFVKCFK